jgi:molybdopterin-guanine dinucleotide biosynthesis protein A
MKIAAAILAGGKASRLGGVAKGLLPDDGGVPVIRRLMDELAAAGITEVIVAANDAAAYAIFEKPIVADIHPGIGPLGGIEAALGHLASRCDAVVLLPCDLPNITACEILKLVHDHQAVPDRVVLAGSPEGRHPLCAVVPVGVLPRVVEAITAGQYEVGRLWRSLGARVVQIDDSRRLVNINTPEDLQQWRRSPNRTRE